MARRYSSLGNEKDAEVLFSRMQIEKDAQVFRRFQAVYLRLKEGLEVSKIAVITGYREGSVRKLHCVYRKDGIEGLVKKMRGGRCNELMSVEEERNFLEEFKSEGKAGGILEVSRIHQALNKKMCKEVSKQAVYNLLHRNDWRKISPRPRHPKASVEAQEAFKKSGLKSLPKQKKKRKRKESH